MSANHDNPEEEPAWHVYYEVQMFLMTSHELRKKYKYLEDMKGSPREEMTKNAILESFLIHTRNLTAFLYEERKDDDIIAQDFLKPDSTYPLDKERFKIGKSNYDSFKKEINKQIAHITAYRTQIDETKKEWLLSDITSRLCGDLQEWVVKADNIHEKNKKEIKCTLDKGCQGLLETEEKHEESHTTSKVSGSVSTQKSD